MNFVAPQRRHDHYKDLVVFMTFELSFVSLFLTGDPNEGNTGGEDSSPGELLEIILFS